MAKISQSYETIMVFSCKNEEAIPALVEKFTTLISDNATVDGVEEWGKRRLAYPINSSAASDVYKRQTVSTTSPTVLSVP